MLCMWTDPSGLNDAATLLYVLIALLFAVCLVIHIRSIHTPFSTHSHTYPLSHTWIDSLEDARACLNIIAIGYYECQEKKQS